MMKTKEYGGDGYEKALMDASSLYQGAEKELATKESQYKDIDSQTKTVIARAFHKSEAKTAKEREMMALWSEEYIAHNTALSVARESFLAAKAERDIQYNRWQTGQTMVSLEKEKMKIL